uniref:Uncharacterized protein n=1 Tax=Lotus japonicus TaxID=34305 RepID=I3SS05_LOTJA|nr:unknown [Lotus japonicus]
MLEMSSFWWSFGILGDGSWISEPLLVWDSAILASEIDGVGKGRSEADDEGAC